MGWAGWLAGLPGEGWVVQRRARRCDCHSVCFHSTCFSWLLSVREGYRGMPPHADKNSPQGLLGSGVFSLELLLDLCNLLPFSPFCPLLSVGSIPSLPEQRLYDLSCRVDVFWLRGSFHTLIGWGQGIAQILLSYVGVTPKKLNCHRLTLSLHWGN